MKVKNVVIGIQYENSSQYEKVINIIKEKDIKLIVAKKGDILKLEENVKINIMWPDAKNKIDENVLNNNSLVFKLESYDFSIIFTGDIEEKAEEDLLDKYKYTNKLKVTVLKVAHHGSKTSSKESIIDEIRPKIALIGVGKNNLFGHPNNKVIERLKNIGAKIYRTDETGEITITVTSKGKIKVERLIE